MLTNTSLTAVQFLLYLLRRGEDAIVLPAEAASQLQASPTYLSKIVAQLAKADIVHTFRGAKGGVRLARAPEEITLLQIVEAAQGRILGDYCREWHQLEEVCSFHHAMYDLQHAIVGALERHTLKDLASKPMPVEAAQAGCRMQCVYAGGGKA